MRFVDTNLEGLKIIELQCFKDSRGFFVERFHGKKFKEHGLADNLLQVNHSFSVKGVIRGLHFQTQPWQCKVVSCISGSIIDVAVDVRPSSPTFGQHFAIKLDSPDKMLYIPGGFAHGFEALEDCNIVYFVDEVYNPASDGGILYNSCGINWNTAHPILSAKDAALPSFEDYKKTAITA
jgi:dTDP-4-dehydrorhamnose 3,5-epimerase